MAEAPAAAAAAAAAAASTDSSRGKKALSLDQKTTKRFAAMALQPKARQSTGMLKSSSAAGSSNKAGSSGAGTLLAQHSPDFFACTPDDIAKAVAEAGNPETAKAKAKKGKVRGVLMFKKVVAKKKNFVQVNGFKLDGAYITKKPYLVAMGYPSHGLESMYRNHWMDIKDYLDRFHTNRYMLFNLCSEPDRKYDKKLFDGRVQEFGFQDHHPPPFNLFLPFCKAMEDFLSANEQNAGIVHCKAGKGRTGVMICAYLIWKYGKSAFESVQIYGKNRTRNGKGVTIPSQRRYLHYWDAACGNPSAHFAVNLFKRNTLGPRGATLDPQPVFLSQIRLINGCPLGKRKELYYITIQNNYWQSPNPGKGKPSYTTETSPCSPSKLECAIFSNLTIEFNPPLKLVNDVKVHFYNKHDKSSKLFHCWFNTSFVSHDPLRLWKHDRGLGQQLDGLHKKKKGGKYADDMAVEFHFKRAPQAEDELLVPASVKKLMDKAEEGLLRAFKTEKGKQALLDESKHYSSIEEAKARLIQVARRSAGQRAMARLKKKYGSTPRVKYVKHEGPDKGEDITDADFKMFRDKVRRQSSKNRSRHHRGRAGSGSSHDFSSARKPRDSYPPSDSSRRYSRSFKEDPDDESSGKVCTHSDDESGHVRKASHGRKLSHGSNI